MTKTGKRIWSITIVAIAVIVVAIPLCRLLVGRLQQHDFFEAAESSDLATVVAALDDGMDVNSVRSFTEGWQKGEPIRITETALYLAAEQGHVDVVRLLIERGADPNIRCTLNATALTNAAMSPGHAEVIRLLVDAGADLTAMGGNLGFPKPALEWAVSMSDYETIQILLEAGRDQGHLKTFRASALARLQWRSPRSMNGRIAKALTAEYPDGSVMSAAMHGDSASLQPLLSDAGYVSSIRDADGWTPLHWSAGIEGSPADVQLLLAHGADPNASTSQGYTPLMAAAEAGDAEKIGLLLQAGADVSLTNEDGDTALHAACKYAPIEAVLPLVEAGADGRFRANDRTRPLDMVRERAQEGGTDITNLLKDR